MTGSETAAGSGAWAVQAMAASGELVQVASGSALLTAGGLAAGGGQPGLTGGEGALRLRLLLVSSAVVANCAIRRLTRPVGTTEPAVAGLGADWGWGRWSSAACRLTVLAGETGMGLAALAGRAGEVTALAAGVGEVTALVAGEAAAQQVRGK